MGVARNVINLYRRVQYAICGRSRYGIMEPGVPCQVEPYKEDINHGDVVHPCVRYIPEGYEGHCWWLVYTPYYGADASMENPILCYAETNEPDPPICWKVYCEVKGRPSKGYNSDPALLYTKGELYVFWREYATEAAIAGGHKVASFGGKVKEGEIVDVFAPVVWSDDLEIDNEVSPAFIDVEGSYFCFAMHLKFHSRWIYKQHPFLKNLLLKIISTTDILGIGSQQKSYGIAKWHSDGVDKPFQYLKTTKINNCNTLYRPWHLDIFEYHGRLYAVIQTNQCNADVCLAYSDDYEHFTFYNKPLITNATIGKLGIYKPTAEIVKDTFYLYYTAQDYNDRALNRLYMTKMPFGQLLRML